MTSLPSARLEAVARRVLEEAAFVLATPTARQPEWPAEVVEVELAFDGPATGVLRLRSTPRFGAEVAANLMGLESGDAEADRHAEGALAELLNIIAGALLADVYGTGRVVRIGIPAVRAGPPGGSLGAEVIGLRGDDVHPIELAAELRSGRTA